MGNQKMWSILNTLLIIILAVEAGESNYCFWSAPTESLICKNTEFRCLSEEKCIPSGSYCNSIQDCADNSDERYCHTSSCRGNYRKCSYSNKCIPNEWLCNGIYDCPNHEDENNCYGRTTTSPTVYITKSPIGRQAEAAANKVKRWVTGQRNQQSSSEKWGSSVDRLALILYHADDKFSTSQTNITEMAYEVKIQFLSQLSSKKLEDIPSTELASYVNAFLVTCVNPRQFHGYDIVQELRKRVDSKNYTNPYVLLAMCNAGETITESDKDKLISTFENKHRTFWTDMQAVVVMALACASKQPGNEVDSETIREMTLELKQQQYRNGTVINLPTTALVLQALVSTGAENDPDNFDDLKAFEELLRNQKSDGSFGDVMNTFLVAPVLTCSSLVNINSSHCQYGTGDEISALENLSRRGGPKIRVHYSLWIGKERDLERNLVLRVPQNMSLYGIMEIASKVDSRFKFEYSIKSRKPYINAITGMRDNPLTGKFWFLYLVTKEQTTLKNESPADIIPRDNDHYVLWYKRGAWVD